MTTSPLAAPGPWDGVVDGYTDEIVPLFERYAEDAIALARIPKAARVLDVAAGPGTLALLAARRARRVDAIDFAPLMIDRLRARAARAGRFNVHARVGDGQALPFPDARFDRAFSMFGLIFFPDRVRGLRELLRVLVPGGRAVVSAWYPAETVPILQAVLSAVRDALPNLPFGSGRAPFGDADELRRAFQEAGFRHAAVYKSAHVARYASTDAYVDSIVRSAAPYVALRRSLGEEAFADVVAKVRRDLRAQFGEGPQAYAWPAHLAVGTR